MAGNKQDCFGFVYSLLAVSVSLQRLVYPKKILAFVFCTGSLFSEITQWDVGLVFNGVVI